MAENFEQNKAHNAELLVEAQFALQKRSEPNIALMSASDYGLQRKIVERLKTKLPEYQFYDIDLTPFKVVSLHKALQEHLPAEVLASPPITYCVNVFGLENSRLASEDGQIIDSGMIAQLNYERELVFRNPNYLTILWGDHDFFVQLQRQAPDFWSWVTYFFKFRQEETYKEIVLEKEFVPDFSGRVPEREEYIKNLEAKLERLPLNDSDKSRTTRERINLYSLLAEEYAKYFDYENSKKYYENALRLCEQLGLEGDLENSLLFGYATLNLSFRHFDLALHLYSKVLEKLYVQNGINDIGASYHQLGRLFQEQRRWVQGLESYRQALFWCEKTGQDSQIGTIYHNIGSTYWEQHEGEQALESYGQALDWYKKTGQNAQFGVTYHNIGMIYLDRKQWAQALENYSQALRWKMNTGQYNQVGDTYHHIGLVYQAQELWAQALESYVQSLDWKIKTGQEEEIGDTYHQIGRVYEEQRQWAQALESYSQALYWKKKTSRDYEIGDTQHHIGRVYEEQEDFEEALKMFREALLITPEHQQDDRTITNDSIQRVKNKIAEKVHS